MADDIKAPIVQVNGDGEVTSVILDVPVGADHPLAVSGHVNSGPNSFDHYLEDKAAKPAPKK